MPSKSQKKKPNRNVKWLAKRAANSRRVQRRILAQNQAQAVVQGQAQDESSSFEGFSDTSSDDSDESDADTLDIASNTAEPETKDVSSSADSSDESDDEMIEDSGIAAIPETDNVSSSAGDPDESDIEMSDSPDMSALPEMDDLSSPSESLYESEPRTPEDSCIYVVPSSDDLSRPSDNSDESEVAVSVEAVRIAMRRKKVFDVLPGGSVRSREVTPSSVVPSSDITTPTTAYRNDGAGQIEEPWSDDASDSDVEMLDTKNLSPKSKQLVMQVLRTVERKLFDSDDGSASEEPLVYAAESDLDVDDGTPRNDLAWLDRLNAEAAEDRANQYDELYAGSQAYLFSSSGPLGDADEYHLPGHGHAQIPDAGPVEETDETNEGPALADISKTRELEMRGLLVKSAEKLVREEGVDFETACLRIRGFDPSTCSNSMFEEHSIENHGILFLSSVRTDKKWLQCIQDLRDASAKVDDCLQTSKPGMHDRFTWCGPCNMHVRVPRMSKRRIVAAILAPAEDAWKAVLPPSDQTDNQHKVFQVSHFCSVTSPNLCENPTHYKLEPALANTRRTMCQKGDRPCSCQPPCMGEWVTYGDPDESRNETQDETEDETPVVQRNLRISVSFATAEQIQVLHSIGIASLVGLDGSQQMWNDLPFNITCCTSIAELWANCNASDLDKSAASKVSATAFSVIDALATRATAAQRARLLGSSDARMPGCLEGKAIVGPEQCLVFTAYETAALYWMMGCGFFQQGSLVRRERIMPFLLTGKCTPYVTRGLLTVFKALGVPRKGKGPCFELSEDGGDADQADESEEGGPSYNTHQELDGELDRLVGSGESSGIPDSTDERGLHESVEDEDESGNGSGSPDESQSLEVQDETEEAVEIPSEPPEGYTQGEWDFVMGRGEYRMEDDAGWSDSDSSYTG